MKLFILAFCIAGAFAQVPSRCGKYNEQFITVYLKDTGVILKALYSQEAMRQFLSRLHQWVTVFYVAYSTPVLHARCKR